MKPSPKKRTLSLRLSAAACEWAGGFVIAAAKKLKLVGGASTDEFVATVRNAGNRRRSEADGTIKNRETYKGISLTFRRGPAKRGGFHDGPKWRTRRSWSEDEARVLLLAIDWALERTIYGRHGLEEGLRVRRGKLDEWLNRSPVDRLAELADTR